MRKPNVVMISLESVRADHLSVYGYPQNTSPFLQKFATEAAVFTRAYSAANWTGASIASILTGLYPSCHGYTHQRYYLDDGDATIASIFKTNGYETICCSNNLYLSSQSGLDAGFETFLYRGRPEAKGGTADKARWRDDLKMKVPPRFKSVLKDGIDTLRPKIAPQRDDGAYETERAVQRWKRNRRAERPFFMYIHYQEPHSIYFPPLPFRKPFFSGTSWQASKYLQFDHMGYFSGNTVFRQSDVNAYRALYDGEIAYLDWRLQRLFDRLDDPDTVWVITADHGELFGENGFFWHAFCLYEPLIRVPLLVRCPEWFKPGVYENLAQTVDLTPTLLDGLGISRQARQPRQGQSLLASNPRKATLTETLNPEPMVDRWVARGGGLVKEDFRHYLRDLRSIRMGEQKLIQASDGRHEFYQLDKDTEEQVNRYHADDSDVRRLHQHLQTWLHDFQPHQPDSTHSGFDKSTWEKMKDLGYA